MLAWLTENAESLLLFAAGVLVGMIAASYLILYLIDKADTQRGTK